jgi:hypothetical protein
LVPYVQGTNMIYSDLKHVVTYTNMIYFKLAQ